MTVVEGFPRGLKDVCWRGLDEIFHIQEGAPTCYAARQNGSLPGHSAPHARIDPISTPANSKSMLAFGGTQFNARFVRHKPGLTALH